MAMSDKPKEGMPIDSKDNVKTKAIKYCPGVDDRFV